MSDFVDALNHQGRCSKNCPLSFIKKKKAALVYKQSGGPTMKVRPPISSHRELNLRPPCIVWYVCRVLPVIPLHGFSIFMSFLLHLGSKKLFFSDLVGCLRYLDYYPNIKANSTPTKESTCWIQTQCYMAI